MGSPGVEGPIFEVPPSPDYIPGPEGPPSPDYVPGPVEPEQTPPSPIYVPFIPEPVYPEFLPGDNESDPEEDLEEDDKEDPEEDPADYHAHRGDDDEYQRGGTKSPCRPPCKLLLIQLTRTHTLLIASRLGCPSDPRRQHHTLLAIEPITTTDQPKNGPTYVEGSLGSRVARIRQRDALPSHVHETEMPEMCLPLRKRSCRTTPGPGYEVGESSAAGAARQVGPTTARADLYGFADMLEATPDAGCLRSQINSWPTGPQSMDAVRSRYIPEHITSDYGHRGLSQSEIVELQAADRRRQTVISELLKADHRRQRHLVETLKIVKSLKTQMIELQRQQGPAKDPAEPELPEEASSSS
ncbi:hypothetical protein Tco_1112925 [Tanacetum coccineum]|uniref:Uncharacterized protein n=1 Tax=Tanacetum coccineum TaxID=301880 RepID=A0ABQ5IQS0_9ASTR